MCDVLLLPFNLCQLSLETAVLYLGLSDFISNLALALFCSQNLHLEYWLTTRKPQTFFLDNCFAFFNRVSVLLLEVFTGLIDNLDSLLFCLHSLNFFQLTSGFQVFEKTLWRNRIFNDRVSIFWLSK